MKPSRKLTRPLLWGTLVVGAATAIAAGQNEQSTDAATSTSAKWAPRKLSFSYRGFTAHYSCDGLQHQIKSILQQLGARDVVAKATNCVRLKGPEQLPDVDATFSVLEPAGGGPASEGVSQNIATRWTEVSLDSDVPFHTGAGACELIEQVKKRVLPLFTIRNLTYSSDCFPYSESIVGARLRMEVLRPAPP